MLPSGSVSTIVPVKPVRTSSRVMKVLTSVEARWTRLARNRFLSCVLVFALCLLLRLTLLPLFPKPQPKIHDEFSYIFGGETLAKGRLSTPTHPLWRFFETYYINMQPTYVSKYPPAQATFLALGIRFFGHPWYGVLISVALMCASICWMLQGWLPPKYALLGGSLAVLQFGVTHYWMESYWGGAVAATGGALVFGALPRLARFGKLSAACAGALGIAILANSRPFEGLVLVFLTFAGLIWWTRGRFRIWFRTPVLLAFAVILLINLSAMADYNLKTTGSATTLPYSINEARYAASPLLWIMPPFPPRHREYRDASMREFWESWELGYYTKARHNPAFPLNRVYEALHRLIGSSAGLPLLFLFTCAIPLIAMPRVKLALAVVALFFCAVTLDKFAFAHYFAPALGACFVVVMFGLRLLRCHSFRGQNTGRALVASVVALSAILFVLDCMATVHSHGQTIDAPAVGFRRQVERRLASEPGMHLVLVRYASQHDGHDEIIFNTPDIDTQKIIWAFDFGQAADRPLLDYYRGRKVWLVQPDGPNPSLEPYSGS